MGCKYISYGCSIYYFEMVSVTKYCSCMLLKSAAISGSKSTVNSFWEWRKLAPTDNNYFHHSLQPPSPKQCCNCCRRCFFLGRKLKGEGVRLISIYKNKKPNPNPNNVFINEQNDIIWNESFQSSVLTSIVPHWHQCW